MSKLIFSNIKGSNRTLNVYEDRVELIQLKNFRAFLTNDLFNGNKTIHFNNILSVQLKPASMLVLGYLQFETANVHSNADYTSENSWTFDRPLNDKAKAICEYVNKRISELRQPQIMSTAPSAADELLKWKSLLDSNIITKEEFEKKKKELIG